MSPGHGGVRADRPVPALGLIAPGPQPVQDLLRTTLERALAIKEAAYGHDHPQVASILTNLSIVQRRLEDKK